MLRQALVDASLNVSTVGEPIRGEALGLLAKSYLLAEAVIERVSRWIDRDVLQAMLRGAKVDLSGREAADKSVEELLARIPEKSIRIAAHLDAKTERYQIRVERVRHGNLRFTNIDHEFVVSGDYTQIRSTAEMLRDLIGAGATIQRGEKKHAVKDFPEAMQWMFAEVQKSMSMQRYKGLGEMNPGQLWETTMDPTKRRLLKVQIEDVIAANEIFTTLMGDEVEPRRAFIESNALGVRNLDV